MQRMIFGTRPEGGNGPETPAKEIGKEVFSN